MKKKGKTLNEFARDLNVSPGYLSNLETGKSDTVKLGILAKLQEELHVLPLSSFSYSSSRLQQLEGKLLQLEQQDPKAAEYVLQTFENGITWFSDEKRTN